MNFDFYANSTVTEGLHSALIMYHVRACFDYRLRLSDRLSELSEDDSISFLDNIALYG